MIAILAKNETYLIRVRKILQNFYGLEEDVLDPYVYTWTTYYKLEVGDTPIRCLISYEKCICREDIVTIKQATNELENQLNEGYGRPVNIDPGYLTLGQFFLATTKDQRHRVYIREGIFVVVTLYFEGGVYSPFPWTYYEYASELYRNYLLCVRKKFIKKIRKNRNIKIE